MGSPLGCEALAVSGIFTAVSAVHYRGIVNAAHYPGIFLASGIVAVVHHPGIISASYFPGIYFLALYYPGISLALHYPGLVAVVHIKYSLAFQIACEYCSSDRSLSRPQRPILVVARLLAQRHCGVLCIDRQGIISHGNAQVHWKRGTAQLPLVTLHKQKR